MIIGRDFAWAHVPKTGGDFTAQLLEAIDGLVVRSDPRDTPRKHDAFYDRAVESKPILLANLRRLPAAVVSRFQESAQRSPRKRRLPPPNQLANDAESDRILMRLGADRLPIVWLRCEQIVEDVIRAVDAIAGLTAAQQQLLRETVAAKPRLDYDHRLEAWFSELQVQRLYSMNPLWAAIEQQVYAADYDPAVAVRECRRRCENPQLRPRPKSI